MRKSIDDFCTQVATEVLPILETDPLTYETALQAYSILDKAMYKSKYSEKAKRDSEKYSAILDAWISLKLPLSILEMMGEGESHEEILKSFPRYPDTLKEELQEARQNLREIMGLEPLRAWERLRQRWIEHWKYLWKRGDEKMRADILTLTRNAYKKNTYKHLFTGPIDPSEFSGEE